MKLVPPTLTYKQAYLRALEDSSSEAANETALNVPGENQTFEDFVQRYLDDADGKNLPKDRVAASMFWLIDDEEVIGRVHIRHYLNDKLRTYGGHIGYYIIPSKRGLGYGKKILELGLQEAKKLNITRVLVTCYDDNIASVKIIEACGGKLENKIEQERSNQLIRRYWIEVL